MLEFEDRKKYSWQKIRKSDFQNFVYMILRLITSSIQTFSLTLYESHSSYHVNKWIHDILNRRVKEIYIHSSKKYKFLSHSLLETMSLEILVLKMNGCDIRVPTIVSLSYLTVLELSGITFTCKTFNDSEKLINLPVLRKYEAENCSWLNVKGGVTFEVPLLEVLLIKHTLVSKPHESHTVVKFCAPRLNDFTYSDFVLRYTVLLDLDLSTARIVAANIHLIKLSEDSEENMATFACEVLKQFNNNVERLKLEVSKVYMLYFIALGLQ
uniref:FBD domain-containing protein n=1 Tax=Cajanus cajan TaxID=3821 RepID=A0A151R9C2_CAJCA|nr:hypothetical protein KK1_039564 [Cajanus cajan]